MANTWYNAAKQVALTSGLNYDTGDLRLILVNTAGGGTTYTFNAAHDFLDDVPAGARIAVSSTLANTTVSSAGAFDADDVTFTALTHADSVDAVIIYSHDGGADSARRLLLYFDTGLTGFPFTPTGADYTIRFNASGILVL